MLNQALRSLRLYREDRREREEQETRNTERIELLAPLIKGGGVGAELGVHKGYFSRVLMDRLEPRRLYLVDPWYLQGQMWTWGDGNRSVVDALCGVVRGMANELENGKAILVIDSDLAALERMPDRHLDWAYLDSTHQYEHTSKELTLLKRKIVPGGILAGDDWQEDPNHRHHGVCRAVNEFAQSKAGEFIFIHPDSFQWAIRIL